MKRLLIVMLIGIAIILNGCGKEEDNTSNTETEQTQPEKAVSSNQVKEKPENEALAGIYLNGGDIEKIEMGIYFGGEQKDFCSLKMPVKYLFAAGYVSENGETKSIESANGTTELDMVLKSGLNSEEMSISNVQILSSDSDSTRLMFYMESSETMTFEGMKGYAGNYIEFGDSDHPAFYYVDTSEYAISDLNVCYSINDDIILSITYEGPLAEEVGLEQLAQNIYDLVEVIE